MRGPLAHRRGESSRPTRLSIDKTNMSLTKRPTSSASTNAPTNHKNILVARPNLLNTANMPRDWPIFFAESRLQYEEMRGRDVMTKVCPHHQVQRPALNRV